MGTSITCTGCDAALDEDLSTPQRPPCPHCGSTGRHVAVDLSDKVEIRDRVLLRAKDPKRTGKQKLRMELITGADLHRQSGKWYEKERLIDKDARRYREVVKDPATGEMIHFCDESLDLHQGHGSARNS